MTAIAAPRARFIDPGAVFAGWVGLGTALVVVIAFELILAVQSLVFLIAPLVGAVIGTYASVRSERWRPRGRVIANAAYAGVVSGVGLAVLYAAIRLIFVYGDSGGLPDGTTLDCPPGPGCAYARYVDAGRGDDLAAVGITDAASFEAAAWREQAAGGATLIVLVLGGSLVGGAVRALREPPGPAASRILPAGASD